jgi:hypothetical protein
MMEAVVVIVVVVVDEILSHRFKSEFLAVDAVDRQ